MEASDLSSQLQEAWFLTQLNRQSSPESSHNSIDSFSYSSPASNWSSSISSPNLYYAEGYETPGTGSCSQNSVEAEELAMPFTQNSALLAAKGPSPQPVLHKSTCEDDMGNPGIAPFEEDVIMDPVLDYINEILMEEGMEDRTCMQQDCNIYHAIVNGFYQIIGEHSSVDCSEDLTASYSSQPRLTDDTNKLLDVADDEYSWIDQFLNSNPSTPLPASRSSSQSSFRQELKAGGNHVEPWVVKDSSAQFPNFQDDGGGTAATPTFQVNTSSGVAAASSYSDAAKTEEELLQMKGNYVSLINGKLKDVGVSNSAQRRHAWEERNATAGGRSARSNRGGQQQGNGCVQPVADGGSPASSTYGDLSFVKNEDLNLEADYANLYVGEWSPRDKGSGATANRKKSSAVGSSKEKGKGNTSNGDATLGFVDLRELLVSCAQAVAGGDARKAKEILQELREHGASPNGSGLQRVAYYFSEALVARMCGTGGLLYMATSNNRPSVAKMLKAFKLSFGVCPYIKLSHYFANQSILKAAEGAPRLHIVDYGILYGMQWPCLIHALADRKGGPPLLVITGIEFPQPAGLNPAERVEDTGRRLAEYAKTYNVPFEYHAIAACKWEDVEPASLHLLQGEVLVVNCFKRLRQLLDESVLADSPRQKVLNRMRSVNPNLLVTAVLSAGYNAPFFVSRFREAFDQYSSFFDMMDTTWGESPERMTIERDCMYPAILNIVACEGVERVERPETYKQWQARIQRAGFEQLPIIPTVLSRARSHAKNHYHKDFNVHDDFNRWMLLGWKGRTPMAISAWKPIST